jgi:ribosomal protein S12 methylthiotransferase accessory factor
VQVELDSIASPPLQILLARLRLAGYEVSVLDARLDIMIPTIIAVVRRRDCGYGALVVTAASHFDPKAAILASVADAAVRQTGFANRTRRLERKLRAALRDFSLIRTIADHGDLYGLPEAARETAFLTEGETANYEQLFGSWERKTAESLDLCNDIDHIVGALAVAGLGRVIVVDLTSPEELRAGLRTVKVFIPGAFPMDFGHGRCRGSGLSRLATIASKHGRSAHHNRWPHPFA